MDQFFLHLLNQILIHPALDLVMMVVTLGAVPLLPLIGWGLIRRGQPHLGWSVLWALVASILFTFLFYYLALRPRPTAVRLLLPLPPFPAYPSGHAASAFATAMVLVLASRRWWVAWVAFGGAMVVGYSRVYLGHHHPSDVMGGAVLGVALGASTYGVRHGGPALVARLQWLVWTQVAIVFLGTQMAYLGFVPKTLLFWPLADKVLHGLLFGAVVFWLNLWLRDRRLDYRGWSAPLAIVLPFSLAFLEEGLQSFSPLRTMDPTDLLSDLIGMLCFWWLSNRLWTSVMVSD